MSYKYQPIGYDHWIYCEEGVCGDNEKFPIVSFSENVRVRHPVKVLEFTMVSEIDEAEFNGVSVARPDWN